MQGQAPASNRSASTQKAGQLSHTPQPCSVRASRNPSIGLDSVYQKHVFARLAPVQAGAEPGGGDAGAEGSGGHNAVRR